MIKRDVFQHKETDRERERKRKRERERERRLHFLRSGDENVHGVMKLRNKQREKERKRVSIRYSTNWGLPADAVIQIGSPGAYTFNVGGTTGLTVIQRTKRARERSLRKNRREKTTSAPPAVERSICNARCRSKSRG